MILEKATEGSPATAGNTILTKRYWGLDLSGSTQSAGGVGGLLATIATKSSPATAGTETHYFHYDANGNVTETVDSNGDLTASYEYGPFGELVSESGSYSAAEGSPDDCGKNTYKFSTKPQDTETGYYYYGYRYYDSSNGRWLSRDPLGEVGGFNVFGFVINDGVNLIDFLGLDTYRINREISGSKPKSKHNPLSHSFIATKDAKGKIRTYGWGSSGPWYEKNNSADMRAARQGFKDGTSMTNYGDIDDEVREAYEELKDQDQGDYDWVTNSCKHNASKLIRKAKGPKKKRN